MSVLFSAIKEKFSEGYTLEDLRSDLLAGIVVGLVAIPLGMALAIATGVAPQHGIYTVIFGGGIVALLGGSRCQVTGPTAAFVVILVPIVSKFGLQGLLIAGFLAGVILVVMGVAKMGRLIQYIPYPVTNGFTMGIAVVIATIQVKDFFGLSVTQSPESFFDRVKLYVEARSTFNPQEFGVAAATLFILILWPKLKFSFAKKIPAPLVALTVVGVVTSVLMKSHPGFSVVTIQSRFNGLPQSLPAFGWLPIDFSTVSALLHSAFAIALLGAIESLLSAVVADGMAQTRHNPDSELIALGVGNMVTPFFGGIPATGAIARTATNIRFGARSPLAAVIHALFALCALLLFAPVVSQLPMAALAALLILVAYNMSDAKHFFHVLKVAPRSDVIVLLVCFLLTVVFDMVIGVSVGVVLAALLFMKRMSDVTSCSLIEEGHSLLHPVRTLPKGVAIYEIAGALFFGAAQRAIEAIEVTNPSVKVVIFWMNDVHTMDVTGLVAFESAVAKLNNRGQRAILAGVGAQPLELIKRSAFFSNAKKVSICESLEQAVQMAKSSLN